MDTISFIKQLNRIEEIVKASLLNRTPNINGERFLSNHEVCKLLKVSDKTLQKYRDSGLIGYIQLDRKILYKESDLLRLLEDNYINPVKNY